MEKEKIEQLESKKKPLDKRLLESIEIIKAGEPEIIFRGYRGEEVPTYEFSGRAEELGELVRRMKNILLRDDQGLEKALGKESLTELKQKVKNFQKSLVDYEKALLTGKTNGVKIGHFETIHPLVREINLPGRLIEKPFFEAIYRAYVKRQKEKAKNDPLFREVLSFEEFKNRHLPDYLGDSDFSGDLWRIRLRTRPEILSVPKKKKAKKSFSLIISYNDDLSCEVPGVNQKAIKRMNDILWEAISEQH